MDKKVTIKSRTLQTEYGDNRESTYVYVDDKLIGSGSYGGEPEDNSRRRDYGWVEDMLIKLALELTPDVVKLDVKYRPDQEEQYYGDK